MRESPAPFLLEFVGMPGAGKSTLSHRVVQTLSGTEGHSISEPTYTINECLPLAVRPLVKLPFAIYGAACEVRQAGWFKWETLLSSSWSPLLNWLFMRGLVANNLAGNHVTVLDQGLIQGMWSFRLTEPDHVVSFFRERLLAVYPDIPGIVVCLEASPETIESRLANRVSNQSRVRRSSETSKGVKGALKAYHTMVDVVEELVDSRSEVTSRTLQNDNKSDLVLNVELIVQEVEDMIMYT